MRIKVVHLVDAFSQVNHGILEAAVATSTVLSDCGVDSEIWFPANNCDHPFDFRAATVVQIAKSEVMNAEKLIERHSLSEMKSIVVSHGSWQYPTRLACRLQSLGCNWVYTPHGMLEPWSVREKKFRKKLYWYLVERRMARRADVVRATSLPEYRNLSGVFKSTKLFPNGVAIPRERQAGLRDKKRVLFLGRLHHKKAPVTLVEGWMASTLCNNKDFELIIVGNDDGELEKLQSILARTKSNIQLRPPVYGDEKRRLFDDCTFFALPSHSEGFPVALLESMAAGLVPLISDGCNLPDALEAGIAIRLNPNEGEIGRVLNTLTGLTNEKIMALSVANQQFVKDNYSIDSIAKSQLSLYQGLATLK